MERAFKGVKAGRYTPKCPHCGATFLLLVTAAEDGFQYAAQPQPANPERTVVGDGDGEERPPSGPWRSVETAIDTTEISSGGVPDPTPFRTVLSTREAEAASG